MPQVVDDNVPAGRAGSMKCHLEKLIWLRATKMIRCIENTSKSVTSLEGETKKGRKDD